MKIFKTCSKTVCHKNYTQELDIFINFGNFSCLIFLCLKCANTFTPADNIPNLYTSYCNYPIKIGHYQIV